jgi:hypothetical protein
MVYHCPSSSESEASAHLMWAGASMESQVQWVTPQTIGFPMISPKDIWDPDKNTREFRLAYRLKMTTFAGYVFLLWLSFEETVKKTPKFNLQPKKGRGWLFFAPLSLDKGSIIKPDPLNFLSCGLRIWISFIANDWTVNHHNSNMWIPIPEHVSVFQI